MNITLAKKAGYCYGVRRAVDTALAQTEGLGPVYCAGPLIHNSFVIKMLEQKNIFTCDDIRDIPDGSRVIIRAHGLVKEDIDRLLGKGCHIIDATCPYVAKIHKIAMQESQKGRKVLIIGKPDHPEVRGIASRCSDAYIVEDVDNLYKFVKDFCNIPISVVCQTTFNKEICLEFVNILKNTCKCVQIFDTICKATELRQTEAQVQAARSDGVVVIGDKASSNSKNLYKLCQQLCGNTVFIDNAEALDISRFARCENVFITAGASTPDLIIEEVYRKMSDEIKNTNGESFEELLEQSLKTLHTGEKVTGVVTQINATDVTVDLGVKQAGYIPYSELSDDPTYNVNDHIKVGDEVEAYVVRVNDVEGWIMLSKKRLDAVKNWEKLEAAVESKETLEGIVVDQNKGGVVALVMGIRVFIPASQTGLSRDVPFDTMMKKTYKMRITEVNRQRRRVVGSIKVVLNEERKQAQEKLWETIAVGNRYKGIVKSFTSYGAFVDIGGVDGMVHISELSWSRIKHPSEVLQIGQEVEVYVLALDHEKKKISLGYRDPNGNPWDKFISTYKVGDVVNVKVVKFMPFGAFAEIMPGVDGLIHISQIAGRRIGRPEEVLQLNQQVDVKIVDIDNEKKKISLSIRALSDPTAAPETYEDVIEEEGESSEDEDQ